MSIKLDLEKIGREDPELLNILPWYVPNLPCERLQQGISASSDYLLFQRPDDRPIAVIIPKGYLIEDE